MTAPFPCCDLTRKALDEGLWQTGSVQWREGRGLRFVQLTMSLRFPLMPWCNWCAQSMVRGLGDASETDWRAGLHLRKLAGKDRCSMVINGAPGAVLLALREEGAAESDVVAEGATLAAALGDLGVRHPRLGVSDLWLSSEHPRLDLWAALFDGLSFLFSRGHYILSGQPGSYCLETPRSVHQSHFPTIAESWADLLIRVCE